MRTYQEEIARLVALEHFDPEAFRPNAEYPKQLCGFVLALALIFNDLKDALLGHSLLPPEQPPENGGPTPKQGQAGGVHVHFMRYIAALLRELMYLVKKNENVRRMPEFTRLLQQMRGEARAAWKAVEDVADARPSDHQIAQFLVRARNSVAFHYDPKEIANGYASAFLEEGETPYLSRGDNTAESRFYFVDRAAQAHLNDVFGDNFELFLTKEPRRLFEVQLALFTIVTSFVTRRGFGWRT